MNWGFKLQMQLLRTTSGSMSPLVFLSFARKIFICRFRIYLPEAGRILALYDQEGLVIVPGVLHVLRVHENGPSVKYGYKGGGKRAIRIPLGFVKRLFWLNQKTKKYFCTGCLKSAVRGCKLNFSRKKISWGYLQPKVGKSQEISGMGCRKIFWVKGKKP